MSPYQYSPLDEKAKEIRLLTLLDDAFPDEPRIIINKVPLTTENPPVFETLSLIHGEQPRTQSILKLDNLGTIPSQLRIIWPLPCHIFDIRTSLECCGLMQFVLISRI